jgi:DNA topoisomerase-3
MNYVCEKSVGPDKSCDFRTGKMILQQEIAPNQIRKLLSEGKTDLLDGFVSSRTNRKFKAFLVKQENGKIGFEFEPRPEKPGRKTAAKTATKTATKSATRTATKSATTVATKTAASKSAAKKTAVKKTAVKKAASKTAAKKTATKTVSKAAAKKAATAPSAVSTPDDDDPPF